MQAPFAFAFVDPGDAFFMRGFRQISTNEKFNDRIAARDTHRADEADTGASSRRTRQTRGKPPIAALVPVK